MFLFPDYNFYPRTKNNAVVWITAHTLQYVFVTPHKLMSAEDYIDFLKRTRWKLGASTIQRRLFANFLKVIDEV